MKKKKKNRVLSTQYLLKIQNVFKENNWEIEDTEDSHDSLFNRYCERILEISENKKRDLILDLTSHYLWVENNQYIDYLIKAMINLIQLRSEIQENTKFYIMPLIAPKDRGKPKSSSMVVYLFNDVKLRYHKILSKYKFEIISTDEEVKKELQQDNAILILADDFIGSGDTAEKCLLHIMGLGIEVRKIVIVSLVAQKQGIDYLSQYGVCISVPEVRQRGISDYYSGEELDKNIQMMEDIERKMSVEEKYRFGYKKSEALVTMCRTPNNTFPIFWEEKGNMKVAPFPRF